MKKKIIILIIVLILIIAGIICACLFNKEKEPEVINIPMDNAVQTDAFKAVVIGKDVNTITVIPNEGETIRDSFKVIEIKIFENTQIFLNNELSNIDSIEINDNVSISSGKIVTVTPTVLLVDKVEVNK